MIKINSFKVEPLSLLTYHSEEDFNKSPTLSARSSKAHSVSETNCSQLSASKIATDSEQEPDHDPVED